MTKRLFVTVVVILMGSAWTLAATPLVYTTSATQSGTTGFNAGGNVVSDGGAPVTERGICWSTTPNPTTGNNKVTSGTGTGTFTCSVTGLAENTHYYFRAYAVTAYGTDYGEQKTIITGSSTTPCTLVWTERQPAGAADQNWACVAISGNGNNFLAGAYGGRLYIWSDGGSVRIPFGSTNANWNTAASSGDGQNLIVGVYPGKVYTTTNGGTSWAARQPSGVASDDWQCVASSSDGTRLVAGVLLGRLWVSLDSGATWAEVIPTGSAVDKDWSCVAMSSDGTTIYAGISPGRLYKGVLAYDGTAPAGLKWFWTEIRPAGSVDKAWACVSTSSDGTRVLAGIQGGGPYVSTNGGSSWNSAMPGGVSTGYWSCSRHVGGRRETDRRRRAGLLWYSTDGGATWKPLGDSNEYWQCVGLSSDGMKAIAAVFAGRLYTASGGQAPTVTASTTKPNVYEGVVGVPLHAATTGTVTSYLWTQTAGKSVVLSGASTADATFTAPTVTTIAESTLTFRCTVTGPCGSDFADVNVKVWPLADSTRDNCVDVIDLLDLIASFGKCVGDASYNPLNDTSGDGCVDVLDLLDMIANFGRCLS